MFEEPCLVSDEPGFLTLLIVGFVIVSMTSNAQGVFYASETGIAEYNAVEAN
jgi:hypothetical protein